MAAATMALSFPLSKTLHTLPSCSAPSSIVHCSTHSSLNGQSVHLPQLQLPRLTQQNPPSLMPIIMMVKPSILFIQGTDEADQIQRWNKRHGYLQLRLVQIDEEGVIQSVDVNAKFVNGKPSGIEAKYVMRTPREWDRFMRFMERYSNAKGLQFIKK